MYRVKCCSPIVISSDGYVIVGSLYENYFEISGEADNFNFENKLIVFLRYMFVCVYPSSSLGWRYGMNGMVIQVHAVNLIEIRLGERWQPISNQS